MHRSGGRGGRGRWPSKQRAGLRVTVFLDADKRGHVIGAQGATVKQTQKDTGAQIRTPKRGDEGPTEVTGPDAISVLRACCLLARQTSSSSDCTCSVAGSAELRATLQVTDATAHRLFETAAESEVPFVAFCLPAAPGSEQRAVAAIDDASFAAGSTALPCWASFTAGELYLFGYADGAAAACAIYGQLAATLPASQTELPIGAADLPRALVQHGVWQAVLLSGSLARGGADHGMIDAALRGKAGLGPAAKVLNMQAGGGAGELYLVDHALLEQIDALLGMQRQVRVEATVDEGEGRTSRAWVYRSRDDAS